MKKTFLALLTVPLIAIGSITYSEWNTATYSTGADGYTVTYSGKSYTVASSDQPGTYRWGNNTAGDANSYYGQANKNQWGGSGDNSTNGYNPNPTNYDERKGPCNDGYHVPSKGEWNAIVIAWCHLDSNSCTESDLVHANDWTAENGLIKISNKSPLVSDFKTKFGMENRQYWSSSPHPELNDNARNLKVDGMNIILYSEDRGFNRYVRCVKNSSSATSTLTIIFMTGTDATQEIGSGTVTENMTGSVPAAVTTTMTGVVNTGYEFSGSWSLSGEITAFDFENRPISGDWADTSGNVYFFAQWTPIKYTISFSGNAADATGTAPATINAEYDSGDIAPDNSFTLTGYTFTGWNTESDGRGTGYATGAELKNLTTTSGANVELYAQWEVNVHKLNFVVDGTTIQSGDVAYAAAISAPAEPKKDCNSFVGWTSSVEGLTTTGTMPDSDVTFTANWNYTCSRSSGGGGGGSSRNTEKSTETQTGSKVDSSTKATDSEDNTQDSSAKASEGHNQGKIYSEEFQNAYEFAYKHGITTMDSIEKADMEGPLTRIAMAKMLSYYAINVLGQKPDTSRKINFKDVSAALDKKYDNGVTLAYQLGIMGINMPNNKFRPNDLVTRAEFATALSRLLFDTPDGKDKYYSTHLAKLMEEKIITNDNPNLQELRGYVMIMLMRSSE